jgi:hypothetical protein
MFRRCCRTTVLIPEFPMMLFVRLYAGDARVVRFALRGSMLRRLTMNQFAWRRGARALHAGGLKVIEVAVEQLRLLREQARR